MLGLSSDGFIQELAGFVAVHWLLYGKEPGMTIVTDYDVPSRDPENGTLDQIKLLVDERRLLLRSQGRGQWLSDLKRVKEIDEELSRLWQRRRTELQ
jgi:hypothetical protein